MTDRKIVINAVESCFDDWLDRHRNFQPMELEQVRKLKNDALTLLKEQEAVKPVPLEDEFGLYRCGKCYHQLFRCVDKYCSRCGRAVKWE